MARYGKEIKPMAVIRKGRRITLDLKAEHFGLSDFVLRYYLDSMIKFYKNQFGIDIAFTEQTRILFEKSFEGSMTYYEGLTEGQKILLDGVVQQLASPANGDLDDNLAMLLFLQDFFARYPLVGDTKADRLTFNDRRSGDPRVRILTMKHDLVELYGPEVASAVCSALRHSYKRELGKDVHFQGITELGIRPSYLNDAPTVLLMLKHAFHDHIHKKGTDEIKRLFPIIVATVKAFEAEAGLYSRTNQSVG